MNLPKVWDLRIDPAVLKTAAKIPRRGAGKILVAIKLITFNPYFGDIQKMRGEEDVWRRRVGSYRIFYKVLADKKIILVFHLERRTSKTY